MVKLVRVSSISFKGTETAGTKKKTVRRNLKAIVKLLRSAALDEPDIVCLPEHAPSMGLGLREPNKIAEEIPGPIFRAISPLAREYGMYIILPMLEKRNGKLHNSAVLIDRSGDYVGSYYKIHPMIDEIEQGIAPGIEPAVFNADFGKLGIAICFDLNFKDVIKGIAERGAKLVFFASMYPGGLQLRLWALEFGVYIVSAYGGDGSMIVNPLGNVLAKSDSYSPIISKTINLDYEVIHLDYNYRKFDSIKRKYRSKIELDVTRPEAISILVSNAKDVTAEDVIREFGLETRDEYFKRALEVRRKAVG